MKISPEIGGHTSALLAAFALASLCTACGADKIDQGSTKMPPDAATNAGCRLGSGCPNIDCGCRSAIIQNACLCDAEGLLHDGSCRNPGQCAAASDCSELCAPYGGVDAPGSCTFDHECPQATCACTNTSGELTLQQCFQGTCLPPICPTKVCCGISFSATPGSPCDDDCDCLSTTCANGSCL